MTPADRPVTTLLRSPAGWLWLVLTVAPMLLLMGSAWFTVDNSPQDDDYLQSFYVVMLHQQADGALQQLQALYGNYFQHNGVFAKLVVLLAYHLSDHVDLQLMNLLGNATLCVITGLLALNVLRLQLPLYTVPLASWMVCSLYPWSVITWPMCPLFYCGTLMLALAAFHCLDLPRPRPLLALACLWLAVFTMANGILAIGIAAVLVGYRQYTDKRYSRVTLVLLLPGTALCLLAYAATFNLFDPGVYGAKTLEQSFVNVGGRLVDFLESAGSVPFFPHVYREGKIALGCVILLLATRVLLSRQSWQAPAIVGLLLFSLGTLLATSLFRYSAGGNNGYQIFTTLVIACTLVLAAAQLPANNRYWPCLLLVMAVAFNGNALLHNLPLMQQHNDRKTAALLDYLTTGQLHGDQQVFGPALREAMEKNLYRPLQHHRHLPIAREVISVNHCPAADNISSLPLQIRTAADAFAVALTLPSAAPASGHTTVWLCGEQHYRMTLDASAGRPTVILLDKRRFAAGDYRLQLQEQKNIAAFDSTIRIEPPIAYTRREKDCQALKIFTRYQSIQPVFDYFCRR